MNWALPDCTADDDDEALKDQGREAVREAQPFGEKHSDRSDNEADGEESDSSSVASELSEPELEPLPNFHSDKVNNMMADYMRSPRGVSITRRGSEGGNKFLHGRPNYSSFHCHGHGQKERHMQTSMPGIERVSGT